MNAPSHATLGAVAGSLTAHAVGADLAVVIAAAPAGALAGLLPDLDHPGSTFGRLLPRWWHRITPGHRGLTHSLLWAVTVGILVMVGVAQLTATARSPLFGLIVTAGIVSHLLADAVTHQGVPWLWPLTARRYRFPKWLAIRTGGLAERVIVSVVTTIGSLVLLQGAW